jgi:hypothetical protein
MLRPGSITFEVRAVMTMALRSQSYINLVLPKVPVSCLHLDSGPRARRDQVMTVDGIIDSGFGEIDQK